MVELGLTKMQSQVLNMILAGESNKAISYRLNVTQRTIESHRAIIHKKAAEKGYRIGYALIEVKNGN